MEITFHGGAGEVGGSCILVENRDNRIALDYGIKVEEGLSYDMPRNLDAAVVTHAHLDHSGNLLTLTDTDTVMIGSSATRDVTMELLQDLVKVQKLNGENIPYSNADVHRVSELWLARKRVALPGMEISLYPAGHVLGADMVYLKTEGKTILYTGDFCLHETEILHGADLERLPTNPDVLIMESTYGGVLRPDRASLVETFYQRIAEAMERDGNVLIPAFAFHRIQEMAVRIDSAMRRGLLPNYNAYCISELARRITKYFNEYRSLLNGSIIEQHNPFEYAMIQYIRRTNQIKEPALVICTSGFGHAGASHSLFLDWAGDEKNSVLVSSGYLPPDSPLATAMGRKIVEGNGESFHLKATLEQIELSGHADQSELVRFVKAIEPKRTLLVHGEPDQTSALSEKIMEYTDVDVPVRGETYIV